MNNLPFIKILPLLFLSFSFAQSLSLPEALRAAEARPGVVNAALELTDARINLNRTLADPLGLRPDRVQAEQRLALAEGKIAETRYEAQQEIARAYTQTLQAQLQRDLAAQAVGLAEQGLTIAQIRFDRGSATALDVRDAETTVQDARNNLRTAQEGVLLSQNNLRGLLGRDAEALEPIDPARIPEVPTLETVLAYLPSHPTLLQVQQGRDLAALAVDLLDPAYAPRAQIEAARLQLQQAETFVTEAQRGLELQARSLHNQAQTAAAGLAIERDALRNAQERLSLERQRLEGGLIAEITFRQAELTTASAALSAVQAEHNYLLALLALQAGTMVPLEGLYDT